ncbi:high mobility group box domain-containing protein, partial [Mucor mucedo]|uniref:high mobility group box domain-containing protein n=1 Tax=Mucor mucedo TaxID=29922 RepID=UPI0022210701
MTNSPTAAKIPRPMNCFMTFRVEKQREILSQCPGANHRDISKIVAKWWRDIPDDKKEPYRVKAAIAKIKHLEQYPNYKYRPQKKTLKTRPYKKRP